MDKLSGEVARTGPQILPNTFLPCCCSSELKMLINNKPLVKHAIFMNQQFSRKKKQQKTTFRFVSKYTKMKSTKPKTNVKIKN